MVATLDDSKPWSSDLEARVQTLVQAVASLEARVARLETRAPQRDAEVPLPAGVQAAPPALTGDGAPGLVTLLALAGQLCLILGGALFLRSLTDAGTLPRMAGATVGLAYASLWSVLAWRVRSPWHATTYALASVLIAYPLVWEATTTFGIFTPSLAVAVLLGTSSVHVGVAWVRSFQHVAWIAFLAALGTAFGLMAATQALVWFTALFLVFGAGSLWLTYGRRWHALRWPAALAADLAVGILAVIAAWPGGPPPGYQAITPRLGLGLALGLVVIYLGSFAARMLTRRRTLNAFETVQSALVLMAGFGGALRVAIVSGSGAGLLGLGVLVAGLGCYAAAFPFAAEGEDLRANFSFFTSLAAIFLLAGGPTILPRAAFALAAGALGLLSMGIGLRLRRTILLLQGMVFLVAAAVASGGAAWTWAAFLDPSPSLEAPSLAAVATVALAACAHVLLVAKRPQEKLGWRLRLPSLLVGALGALGAAAGCIWFGLRIVGPAAVDPGQFAAFRTGVLSVLAIGLAALARPFPASELPWLVFPLLGLDALKFILQDLSIGRPLTLFPAFMAIGAALILAPRFLKTPPPSLPPAAPRPHS